MVILGPLSFSLGNASNVKAWAVLVQSDGPYSALSPIEHRNIIHTIQWSLFYLLIQNSLSVMCKQV